MRNLSTAITLLFNVNSSVWNWNLLILSDEEILIKIWMRLQKNNFNHRLKFQRNSFLLIFNLNHFKIDVICEYFFIFLCCLLSKRDDVTLWIIWGKKIHQKSKFVYGWVFLIKSLKNKKYYLMLTEQVTEIGNDTNCVISWCKILVGKRHFEWKWHQFACHGRLTRVITDPLAKDELVRIFLILPGPF